MTKQKEYDDIEDAKTIEEREPLPEMSAADIKQQASETMMKSLLESLLLQIKQLQRPWQEMTKLEQDEVIEALRKNVKTTTDCAVRLIAGNGAITVVGDLDSVTIKDGVKAVVKVSSKAENLPELFDAVGNQVLIVCAGNAVYDKDLDTVAGDPDQADMFDAGAEYRDEDGLDDDEPGKWQPKAIPMN